MTMYLNAKDQKDAEFCPFNISTIITEYLDLLSYGVSKDFAHYAFRTIFPRSEHTSNNCTDS